MIDYFEETSVFSSTVLKISQDNSRALTYLHDKEDLSLHIYTINFMEHVMFISNKTNRYTFHSRSKVRDKVFQIVHESPKMCHVTQQFPLAMHYMLAL